ncbi:hypothetical protein BDK51DRAFT_26332, partial [Blyttiomyces helicus]
DQESRLDTLRARARQRSATAASPAADAAAASFASGPESETPAPPERFNLFEDLVGAPAPDPEAEKEAARRKHELQLSAPFSAKDKAVPWYAVGTATLPTSAGVSKGNPPKVSSKLSKAEKLERDKRGEDPLRRIAKHTSKEKRRHEIAFSAASSERPSSSYSSSGLSKIEALRAERIKREAAERARAQSLLNPQPTTHESNPRFFNSQFNPDFVRSGRR